MKTLFKNLRNKLFAFKTSFVRYCVGPSFHIENRKIKVRDPNNFTIIISLIFSFVFALAFRSAKQFFTDIKQFFAFPFSQMNSTSAIIFAITGLVIVFAIVGVVIISKRKYICLGDALGMIGFMFSVFFFIYEAKAFGIAKDTWLLWVFMIIPNIPLMFSLGVRTFRFFLKFIKSDSIVLEKRINDYNFFIKRKKQFGYRFLLFFKDNWGQVLIVIALIALAAMVLYPMVVLILRSIRDWISDYVDPFAMPKTFTFENYEVMWEYLKGSFFNSLFTAIMVTLGSVILSSMTAFAFVRYRFPLKNVLFYAIIGLMMIPGLLTLISRYQEVQSMHLVGSLWGIILPGVAGGISGGFLLLFTFFKGLPHDLFEAMEVDGANDFSIYLKMVLPLSKPILSTIIIQSFVGEWNDYLWAYLITNGNEDLYTLPVYLNALSDSLVESGQTSIILAGYVISAIPLVLIFIVASKQFIEGLTSGAFKM